MRVDPSRVAYRHLALRKKPRGKARVGDCYEASGKYIIEKALLAPPGERQRLILVHGEVMGQGPMEGITFGHAWVLDGNTVIDKSNGRDLRMPKAVYYAIGQIERIGNYHEYTPEDARDRMLRYGHYGPWDLRTRSGL